MSQYITGFCRTNLDNYDCSLVTIFVAIPNKGDMVQVLYKGNVSYLRVVSVMHKQRAEMPYIEIELHN